MKKILLPVLALLIALAAFLPSSLGAYSLNAYNGTTGSKVFGVSPALYSSYDPEFELALDPVLAYGFSDKFDLYFNPASLVFFPEFEYGGTWIMPRYDFGGNNIVGLQFHALYESSAFAFNLIPQYHLFIENDKTAFEMNALFTIPLDAPETTEIRLVLAPVWKVVPDRLSLFLELDTYSTIDNFNVFTSDLIPGACVDIGEGQLCVGFVMGDLWNGFSSPGVNCWYYQSFGGE